MRKIFVANQHGITLMTMVITVIIILILATAVTYTGIDIYESSQFTKFLTYMQSIQEDVDLFAEKGEKPGQTLNSTIQSRLAAIIAADDASGGHNEIETSDVASTDLRYFSRNTISNVFGLDLDEEIIVNFGNREVISLYGILCDGQRYYTQYQLPGGATLSRTTIIPRELTFNVSKTIDGLNATITISNVSITNGTLSYREKGTANWRTIANYTIPNKAETVQLSESGIYEIRLVDNTSGTDNYSDGYPEVSIALINEPKLTTGMTMVNATYDYAIDSSHWAYATDGINYYLWIPKFVCDANNNIMFIRGNTNVGTEYAGKLWRVSTEFNDGKTGIWKQVANTNTTTLSLTEMVELLPIGWSTSKISETVTEEINGVTYNAPVPVGFVASEVTTENLISKGLVIYEGTTAVTNANVDTEKTTRNQFVWIPVPNLSEIVNTYTTNPYGIYTTGYSQGKFYTFSGTTATVRTSTYGLGTSRL